MAYEVMNTDPVAYENRGDLEAVYKALEEAANLARDVEIVVGRIVGHSRIEYEGKQEGQTNVKAIATSVVDKLTEQASKTQAAVTSANKSAAALAEAFGV